jgi:hypothetical protein
MEQWRKQKYTYTKMEMMKNSYFKTTSRLVKSGKMKKPLAPFIETFEGAFLEQLKTYMIK